MPPSSLIRNENWNLFSEIECRTCAVDKVQRAQSFTLQQLDESVKTSSFDVSVSSCSNNKHLTSLPPPPDSSPRCVLRTESWDYCFKNSLKIYFWCRMLLFLASTSLNALASVKVRLFFFRFGKNHFPRTFWVNLTCLLRSNCKHVYMYKIILLIQCLRNACACACVSTARFVIYITIWPLHKVRL